MKIVVQGEEEYEKL